MTVVPPDDPLVALWQTAPAPAIHDLAKHLQRLDRLHRLSNRSIVALLWCVALLLIFEEATGRLPSLGFLSLIWILGLVSGLSWRRRAQCTRLAALTSDTVSVLKFRLAQARRDLFLARCLYTGVPLGALVGYVVMTLAGSAIPPPAASAAPNLKLIQTGAGIAVLLVMIATGAILSHSRVLHVKALTEKLKVINDEL